MDKKIQQDFLTTLRQILSSYFSEGELRTLCFDLGLDYDDLPAIGKVDKSREIVSFFVRRNRLQELTGLIKKLRPKVSFNMPPEMTHESEILRDNHGEFSTPQELSEKGNASILKWDVFICYAHEDKLFATKLANALQEDGLLIWYDDFSLSLGDNLRRSIDNGLAKSKFGIVILSHSFFQKKWTQYELDGLVERDLDQKVILPIWHEITREDLLKHLPSLANKVAISSFRPVQEIVNAIKKAISQSETKTNRKAITQVSDEASGAQLEKPRLDILRNLPSKSNKK